MSTRIKTSGRMTKMKLPKLKFANPKDVWDEYRPISWMSVRSGYTAPAIRKWIKQKKIKGWLFQDLIVIRKDTELPPSSRQE